MASYISQISPSKIRVSPSRYSPSRVSNLNNRPIASPRGSPQRSVLPSYPMGSPGGQRITQKHLEENYQKVDDNIKYSQYIQKSRENSIRKSQSPGGIASPSRIVQQSSYIASPTRVSRVYGSPSRYKSQISESPSRFSEKEQLMQLLRRMINCDRELQNLKTELSVRQDFNLLDAFRLFDVNQNQNISKLEFENALNKMGVFPSQDQIYLFYKVYDLDQDGFLQYGDFTKVFYSPNQTQVSLLNSRIPKFVEPLEGQTDRDIFTFDTRQIFKRFFNQIFDTETTIDSFRESLQKRPLFNLYDSFKTLDLDQDGVINYEELKIMLNSYGIYTTENDMINLFERFDRDKDGKIKYQEFVQEVAPKSPQRYSKY